MIFLYAFILERMVFNLKMRILWTINTIYPSVEKKLGAVSKHSISWVDAMANELKDNVNIELAIFAPGFNRCAFKKKIDGITFYISKSEDDMKYDYINVIEDFHPDLIHAYGTEAKHNYYIIKKYSRDIPIIISLQGIIFAYINHYYGGMSFREILSTYGILDMLLFRGMMKGKRLWEKQIVNEIFMFKNVNFVEGRSDWDKAVAFSINPKLKYYFLPRMIRKEFYEHNWNYKNIEVHSLFANQGSVPHKGTHYLIKALALVKPRYPDIMLYISGDNPIKKSKRHGKLRGYSKFVSDLIHKFDLTKNIKYTGRLSAHEMAERLQAANICIVPSAIENAANAIAEAMVVGTPIIASYVGGTPEMLEEGKLGYLYPYDEAEMLAARIDSVFSNIREAAEKSKAGKMVARERHNSDKLVKGQIDMYEQVLEEFHAHPVKS